MTRRRPAGVADGAWTMLFPITYGVHIAEELWGGETFHAWLSRVASVDLSRDEFIRLNAVAWLIMFAATIAAGAAWPRLIAALATVVAMNGTLHVAGSVVTASYSPGVISGVLLWIPLGLYALRRAYRGLPLAEFLSGVTAGVLAHAAVSVAAFFI
jgi:hypothetical protein